MKKISIHVSERIYNEIESIAWRTGRPVAELIREALVDLVERERRSQPSVLSIEPHDSGRVLARWKRCDFLEETTGS
jgi:hypothetical protein